MHTSASRLSIMVPFAAVLIVLGAACAGEGGDDDAAPADTVATAGDEGASDAPVAGLEPGQSSTTEAVITNTMPHAMVVTIQYEGGGETELGVVPPSGEQTFTLAASPGETVVLVASDEADTHSRDATLTLSEGTETWTIE